MEFYEYLYQIEKEYEFSTKDYLIFDDLYQFVYSTKKYLELFEFMDYCLENENKINFVEKYYFLCRCMIYNHNERYKED